MIADRPHFHNCSTIFASTAYTRLTYILQIVAKRKQRTRVSIKHTGQKFTKRKQKKIGTRIMQINASDRAPERPKILPAPGMEARWKSGTGKENNIKQNQTPRAVPVPDPAHFHTHPTLSSSSSSSPSSFCLMIVIIASMGSGRSGGIG